MKKPNGIAELREPLSRMKVSILRRVNFLLAVIYHDAGVPELHVDFSSIGCFMWSIDRFLKSGAREMLEGKNYREVVMVFPIIGADMDPAAGFQNCGNMTDVSNFPARITITSQPHFYKLRGIVPLLVLTKNKILECLFSMLLVAQYCR